VESSQIGKVLLSQISAIEARRHHLAAVDERANWTGIDWAHTESPWHHGTRRNSAAGCCKRAWCYDNCVFRLVFEH
jgi:hypothetical protein